MTVSRQFIKDSIARMERTSDKTAVHSVQELVRRGLNLLTLDGVNVGNKSRKWIKQLIEYFVCLYCPGNVDKNVLVREGLEILDD